MTHKHREGSFWRNGMVARCGKRYGSRASAAAACAAARALIPVTEEGRMEGSLDFLAGFCARCGGRFWRWRRLRSGGRELEVGSALVWVTEGGETVVDGGAVLLGVWSNGGAAGF